MSKKAIQLKQGNTNIYPIPYYPIGAIYINSSNENPSTKFGGTWELVDKEFKAMYTNTTGFTPSSNIKNETAYFTRSGHTIVLNLAFTTNTEFDDSTILLGTIDYETIGVSRLQSNTRETGFSDPGNVILMLYFPYNTGEISCVDIVGANTLASDSSCYATITFQFNPNYMLDSACDKFYWKRIA